MSALTKNELWIDGFAGGGGASTGIARAIGRDVDIAINHDPRAIAIHKANHATTEHHCQDIRIVWPLKATKIVDIGLRMLTPRELARAQGFPDSYVLDPMVPQLVRGKWVDKRLSKAAQIRMIGNSVCPPVAEALVRANLANDIEIAPEALAA